jgi:molybdopterin synthase sulfur carrier subunit
MPTFFIPTPMRKTTGNNAQIQEVPGRMAELLGAIESKFPGFRNHVCDAEGQIKKYVNIFVNGDEIRTLDGLDTTVNDRDEVYIIPAMAGG